MVSIYWLGQSEQRLKQAVHGGRGKKIAAAHQPVTYDMLVQIGAKA